MIRAEEKKFRLIQAVGFISIVLTAFFLMCLAAGAAEPVTPPEIDVNEVLRHGDMVQIIDRNWRADGTDVAVEALGPPADDNHKWFISVVSSRGCGACVALKSAWKTDPHLLALANPDDVTDSWAHLNFYDREDASQNRRWAGLKITGYPTIYVQPPLNGKYGSPATVVCQILGFDGNDRNGGKKLALAITSSIAKYAAKHEAKQVNSQDFRQEEYGVNPPFNPPPKVDGPITTSGVTFPQLLVPSPEVTTASSSNVWFYISVSLIAVLGLSFVWFIFIKASESSKAKAEDREAALMRKMLIMIESAKEPDKKAA